MLDLSPFLNDWLFPFVGLLLAGFTMWMMARSSAWLSAHAKFLNASTQTKILGIEQKALDEAASLVFGAVRNETAGVKLTIDSPIVRWGIQVAVDHAAGVLSANGAAADDVARKILARLPPAFVSLDTTGAIVSQPLPVQTATLKPIG